MDLKEIKRWMKTVDKTPVDIASDLRMSPQTIQKYLSGRRVLRSTQKAIEDHLKAIMTPLQKGSEVA